MYAVFKYTIYNTIFYFFNSFALLTINYWILLTTFLYDNCNLPGFGYSAVCTLSLTLLFILSVLFRVLGIKKDTFTNIAPERAYFVHYHIVHTVRVYGILHLASIYQTRSSGR